MGDNFLKIEELLRQRADLNARLNLLPYKGSVEVKTNGEKKYLYMRNRVGARVTSTYVDVYSDLLYDNLLRYSAESKELKKQIRKIERELIKLGFAEEELSNEILRNIDFAKTNMKSNIYSQAILEGVATSFPQTEDIIENGIVSGVTATDVQKILNLKHAWEFITDKDVILSGTSYYVLCHIAKLVNEGFFADGGRIRGVPVTIGGTNYVPAIPDEIDVKAQIDNILNIHAEPIDIAIKLCLFVMKTQIFNDGNKRAAVIFANHYLISKGAGMLVIPESEVPDFKKLLIAYYEDKDNGKAEQFLKQKCYKKLN